MTPTRRILAIDGGGVRGVIPAALLASMERATGRATRETFDFVAGTSTGAILTAGLVAGIPAERLVSLYVDRAAEVFRSVPLLSVVRRVVAGHQYDTRALHRVIREELGTPAADWALNDAPVDLLVTTKRLSDGMPWYFVRDDPANAQRAGATRLADAVTASAAAPTYFAPWTVAGVGELVDGGVGVAGNPVYQACVEAFEYTDRYHPEQTVVVSLGTGRVLQRERPGWLGSWVGWLLSELLRSPAEQQTELVHRHYPAVALSRIDVELPGAIGMDAADRVDELREVGERLAATVEWAAVLDGRDERFRVTGERTLPREYVSRDPG